MHEELAAASYAEASHIATSVVSRSDRWSGRNTDLVVDRIVTHRLWAFPIMFALLAFVFWITISGANVPSSWLSATLVERGHPFLRGLAEAALFPPWLTGVLVDGAYLATAWVVSVMLPPMAIFFPLFTLLEDLGYLPRVAFNLDPLFRRSGAHGRQALTMSMGFGCNAAGVVSTRIIDSPRERMIAILTNNFALCNGRWPSMILLATLFIAAGTSPPAAGLVAAAAVAGVALLGVGLTLAVSWGLSRSVLRGQVSTFSLELPPYRSPRVWQTLYTSLLDRTIFVLGRAAVLAAPAGALIWLTANVQVGGASVAEHLVQALDPPGLFLGMNGVILLAYVIAIPANEIVIPTVLMLTVLVTDLAGSWAGAGVIFETGSALETMRVLQAGGWTALTAVNVMLFSLAHNPCGTTLHTIYRETGSVRWTAVGALLPLAVGGALTFIVTRLWWWCTSLG